MAWFFTGVDNSHIAHGISAPCCVLLRQRLFQAEEDDEEILNAAPDLFSGEDQLNQGLKTQGAGESLQAQEEEMVVNAIDMEDFIETPKLGKAELAKSWPRRTQFFFGPLRLQDRWQFW